MLVVGEISLFHYIRHCPNTHTYIACIWILGVWEVEELFPDQCLAGSRWYSQIILAEHNWNIKYRLDYVSFLLKCEYIVQGWYSSSATLRSKIPPSFHSAVNGYHSQGHLGVLDGGRSSSHWIISSLLLPVQWSEHGQGGCSRDWTNLLGLQKTHTHTQSQSPFTKRKEILDFKIELAIPCIWLKKYLLNSIGSIGQNWYTWDILLIGISVGDFYTSQYDSYGS